eukprot:c16692_g1_i1 orf=716-1306(+)
MAFSMERGSAGLVVLFLGLLAALDFGVATDHIVGKNRGWQVPAAAGPTVNLNYTDWAGNETFYLGDTITFHYQENQHSVFQVNYSTYVNCTINMYVGHDWIYNWSNKGGRVVILLNETKVYYFVCGFGGHCQQGMKVAVSVSKLPAPQTSKHSSSGHKSDSGDASSLIVASAALMGSLIYTIVWILLAFQTDCNSI